MAASSRVREPKTSAKFRPDGIRTEPAAAGLAAVGSWTDPEVNFAFTLARADG